MGLRICRRDLNCLLACIDGLSIASLAQKRLRLQVPSHAIRRILFGHGVKLADSLIQLSGVEQNSGIAKPGFKIGWVNLDRSLESILSLFLLKQRMVGAPKIKCCLAVRRVDR